MIVQPNRHSPKWLWLMTQNHLGAGNDRDSAIYQGREGHITAPLQSLLTLRVTFPSLSPRTTVSISYNLGSRHCHSTRASHLIAHIIPTPQIALAYPVNINYTGSHIVFSVPCNPIPMLNDSSFRVRILKDILGWGGFSLGSRAIK